MKYLNHIHTTFVVLLLSQCALVTATEQAVEHVATQAQSRCQQKSESVSLEWVDLTLQNISTDEMKPFLEQLEAVYISAFTEGVQGGVFFASAEKTQEMIQQGGVEKVLVEGWKRNLEIMTLYLTQGLEKIHCAVIKNAQNDILGFACFLHLPRKKVWETVKGMGVIKEVHWIKESKKTPEDNEVYVRILAVRSDRWDYGYGRELVFSIFSRFSHITKIYLGTDASGKARGFYEHCGFECTKTYINTEDKQYCSYEFNR